VPQNTTRLKESEFMKKYFITTTALAGAFAIGIAGAPLAQGVNPAAPGSASGGTMAQGQSGTPGSTTRPGSTMGGQMGSSPQGGAMGQTGSTPGQAGTTPGQTGSTMGQTGTTPGQGGPMGQTGATTGRTGATTGQTGATQPGGAGGSSQQANMNEEQIRGMLSARGYTDIQRIERDGDNFKVGEAKRYGREVKDLRVDARTGQVRDEARLNEEQARNLLEQRGYSEVSEIRREGDNITAKAKRDNREMRVRIDDNTGAVIPQPSSN
jgi:hypothetical protein